MGNWNISVQGTGAHHNKNFPNDADKMFAKFVADLMKAGHTIQSADFTSGGNTHLPETVFPQSGEVAKSYIEHGWKRCEATACYYAASGEHLHKS